MACSLVLITFDSPQLGKQLKQKIWKFRILIQRYAQFRFFRQGPGNSFFFIWVFFHDHSRITGLQGKEEGISLTPHYHFYPLHRHLDISCTITAESSPLHIGSSRSEPGTFDLSNQAVFLHDQKVKTEL